MKVNSKQNVFFLNLFQIVEAVYDMKLYFSDKMFVKVKSFVIYLNNHNSVVHLECPPPWSFELFKSMNQGNASVVFTSKEHKI